jgi:calcineurin-like phosphoesterase family protein
MAKNQFNLYVWSDPHIGHDNFNGKGGIIRHANRPFASEKEMTKQLSSNWNRAVRPQDIGIVLGDYIWTGGPAEQIKEKIKLFNGRIILVLGNHDKKGYSWYMSNGIDFVCDRFAWNFNDKRVLFIHDPENVSIEERNKYQFVLHGHQHQNSPLVRQIGQCTFVNLSVENINYSPINLIVLLNRLSQGYYDRKNNF